MNQMKKSMICILLAVWLMMGGSLAVFASDNSVLDDAVKDMAAYIYDTVPAPQIGTVGGEWAVIGLARSGFDVPEGYYESYYRNVEDTVKDCEGVLHDKKYTEYARVVLALTAIGKDPANVAGYDLLAPLGDFDKTVWQGINGPIWALIALDSGNYEVPQNPAAQTQATRERYIGRIMELRLPDGGWALSGSDVSDPDVTGMALQALAKYQDREDIKQAIGEALDCMSAQQDENGGFSSWGMKNSESCVQMLVALCELGLPLDDARFVKNGNTLLDYIMTYYVKGKGFQHTSGDSGFNLMASEQGLYGLVAAQRLLEGKSSLYHMNPDRAVPDTGEDKSAEGLPGKHEEVRVPAVQIAGKTFSDISAHASQPAVDALAERGIISGMTEDTFMPDATMTRAEFATIMVRGLGLPIQGQCPFRDVAQSDWFSSYVGTAYHYGIVTGVSEDQFEPYGTITREEAAVMVARSAALCGMDTKMDPFAARDVLAGFTDYVEASQWAISPLAFCYHEKILPDDAMEIQPQRPITRAEIAQMLFCMLQQAELL